MTTVLCKLAVVASIVGIAIAVVLWSTFAVWDEWATPEMGG
jgi:hypothetical protein